MSETIFVVGGGMSGIRAAINLLGRGYSVAIFEANTYPIQKLNCGVLTRKAKQMIDNFPEEVITQKLNTFGWYDSCRKVLDVPLKEELELIDRGSFDAWYLKQFEDMGGTVYSGYTITGIDPTTKEMFMNSPENKPVKSSYESLVIACGVKSITQFVQGEVAVENPATVICTFIDKPAKSGIDIDYGFLPGGRCFVVPYGNQTLVGIAGVGADKEKFNEYLYNCRIDRPKDSEGNEIANDMVAVMPTVFNKYFIDVAVEWAEQGIFLVGEALGLTEPIMGEGTYLALKSADLVTPHVWTRDIELYRFSLTRLFSEMEEMFKGAGSFFDVKKPQSELVGHIIDHCLNLGDVPYNKGKVEESMKHYLNMEKMKNDPRKMEAYNKAQEKKARDEQEKKQKAKEARTKGKMSIALPKVTGIPLLGKKEKQ